MKLSDIADNAGSRKKRMRVGRGIGSGKGKTAGRGGKGQTARSGVRIKGFEGGQMPIHRRLPKRGFTNIFRLEFAEINLDRIQQAIDAKLLDAKATINAESLVKSRVMRRAKDGVRLLGRGELKAKLNIEVHGASKSAIAAVEKAGGTFSPDMLGWMAPIYVAETDERAMVEAKPHIEAFANKFLRKPPEMKFPPGYVSRRSYKAIVAAKSAAHEKVDTRRANEMGMMTCGSAATVATSFPRANGWVRSRSRRRATHRRSRPSSGIPSSGLARRSPWCSTARSSTAIEGARWTGSVVSCTGWPRKR